MTTLAAHYTGQVSTPVWCGMGKGLWARVIVVSLLGLSTFAQAQAIRPDTLEDLKGEYEHHERQFKTALDAVAVAEKKYSDCVFGDPNAYCGVHKRELRQQQLLALEQQKRFDEAKEAYERAQRKAERAKPAQAPTKGG